MIVCHACGTTLSNDEIALFRKMVNRQAVEFLCKTCLAEHFSCDVELLDQKIQQFRNNGCFLFAPVDSRQFSDL